MDVSLGVQLSTFAPPCGHLCPLAARPPGVLQPEDVRGYLDYCDARFGPRSPALQAW